MAQYRVITMLEKTFEAQRERALLTLELLTVNPAGIGEHPDLAGAIDSQVDVIASAEDKLGVINKHYSDKPEMLIENEDAQLVLNI